MAGAVGGRPKDRPPPSASSQQAAWAGGLSADAQARGTVPTLILAESLASRRRRSLGMTAFSGRVADGADPAGVSTLAPLVTLCAVTFARSRKVARNVLR